MKDILVVKFFSLGDVLLSTPLLQEIKRIFPESYVTFCVGEYAKSILQNNPNVQEIVSVKDRFLIKRNIPEILKLILKLREKKYDIIFILHRAIEFKIFSTFLKGKKIGVWKIKKDVHESIKYLEMLKLAGYDYFYRSPEVFLSKEEENFSERFFSIYGIEADKKKIAICPGGGRNPKTFYPQKRWSTEGYLKLVRLIFENTSGYIILVGDETEKDLSQKISSSFPHRVVDLTGKLKIRELLSIMKKCSLFVGCDSGLMHVASSLGIPTVALFGPTDEKVWGPTGEKNIVVRKDIPCSPCYKNDGNFKQCTNNICMQNITAEEVWEKCKILLKD